MLSKRHSSSYLVVRVLALVLVHMLNPDFLSQTNAVIFCLHRAVVLVFSDKYYEMLDWVFVFDGFYSAED